MLSSHTIFKTNIFDIRFAVKNSRAKTFCKGPSRCKMLHYFSQFIFGLETASHSLDSWVSPSITRNVILFSGFRIYARHTRSMTHLHYLSKTHYDADIFRIFYDFGWSCPKLGFHIPHRFHFVREM